MQCNKMADLLSNPNLSRATRESLAKLWVYEDKVEEILGRSQAERHLALDQTCVGSNPTAPVRK